MSRRGNIKKRPKNKDTRYNDVMVDMLIKQIMRDGKKSLAEKIVYKAFINMSQKSSSDDGNANADPVEMYHQALENVMPILEVKGKRIGGATYQVPHEVSSNRRQSLGVRWIVLYARSRKERGMYNKLAAELLDAYKGTGGAVKKKEDVHRMAEANKAFSHYNSR